MLNSEFLGVATVGEYHNGFDGVDISVLPDNDALYTGWLPEWGRYEEALPQMDTNTQLFIGVFKQENGKKSVFCGQQFYPYQSECHAEIARQK